jgi:aryl-alcohol dehydrogenase-like predicted oxidoreductase
MSSSRIGLGTNRLAQTAQNVAFIRDAVDDGIAHIDTAHVYARGESEQAIGAALSLPADGIVVATKGGHGDGRPEALRAQIEQSLRRLQTERIDLYYLHRVDTNVPLEESLGAIAEYRERGAIRDVGVSEATVEQIERARKVVPIAAVQNHYNLSERRHEDVVDHCEREEIWFVPYFPLRGDPPPALAQIARRHGVTETQIALAWMLRRSPAMRPIPGSLSLDHVRENLAAAEIALSDDEFAALR